MSYYELYQQNPGLCFVVILVSIVLTILVYGAFPIVFAKTRKKYIAQKKYKRLCYTINAVGMLFFIVINGASSGGPYLLWTWIFSRRGAKILQAKGLFDEIDGGRLQEGTSMYDRANNENVTMEEHQKIDINEQRQNAKERVDARKSIQLDKNDTLSLMLIDGEEGMSNKENCETVMEVCQQKESICKKCGSVVYENQTFCPNCGRKVRKKTNTSKSKVAVRKVRKIVMVILIVLLSFSLVAGGIYAIIEKHNSYDLSTTFEKFGEGVGNCYVYSIKNTAGKQLSEVLYMKENYYIKVICNGDKVYISEKGIYEHTKKQTIMQSENGDKSQYIRCNGYIIEKDKAYEGEIVSKKSFSAAFTKEIDGVVTTVDFSDDKTYRIERIEKRYVGKYTRKGCEIEGVCEDINGSCKWVVYRGQLVEGCFVGTNPYDSDHTERAQYEFYKYLAVVAPEKLSAVERWIIYDYEEKHPISAGL